MWKKLRLCVVVLPLVAGCEPRSGSDEEFAGTPRVVDDSVLVFPGGARVATGLRSIQYHDQLPTESGPPFLVLSGIECDGCDESDRAIFLIRARGAPSPQGAERSTFAYPGARTDPAAPDSLQAESRLFVGECLYGGVTGVVQVATTVSEGRPQETVVATEVAGDTLMEIISPNATPTLQDVLAAVEQGRCREIQRRDRPAAP